MDKLKLLKLKDKWVPVVLFGFGVVVATIGQSEKIMFLSVAGFILSFVIGLILAWQVMVLLGIPDEVAGLLVFALLVLLAGGL